MTSTTKLWSLAFCGLLISLASFAASNITPQQMADAIYAVIESDRAVYTQKVVHRLQNEEEIIEASEHWKEEQGLPLPAQMLRMGAERVNAKNAGFNYALLSLWAINKQNSPKTELEKKALQMVAEDPNKNFYGEEILGGKKYFTAVYADIAVSEACIKCHNKHVDSPKSDFKLNDVMGGLVIRIPIE
jgi:hypothetical protein